MKCKVCGAEINTHQLGFAIGARASCGCGWIRSRERAKGCPKCGSHADHKHPVLNLFLVKRMFSKHYEMRCDKCGHKWRVKE